MENENNFYNQPDSNQQNNQYGQPDQQYNQNNQYGQQNNQYGQQNQYGQPNQQYTFGENNTYGGIGYDPGQMPKNRFGMKLTFSILEIITCNPLSVIMGIVGCVFTSKANVSHREGRWEDFKAQAKTSAVCLWIGFVAFILGWISIAMIWTYGGGKEDFMEGFMEGYNEAINGYGTPAAAANGEGASVYVDGVCISLPMEYADIQALGFTLDTDYVDNTVDGYSYDFCLMTNADGEYVMWCWFENPNSSEAAVTDCRVVGVDVDYNCDNYETYVTNEGLGFFNSESEYIAAYGDPDDVEEEEGQRILYWYLDNGSDTDWRVIEVTFEGDIVYDIDVDFR